MEIKEFREFREFKEFREFRENPITPITLTYPSQSTLLQKRKYGARIPSLKSRMAEEILGFAKEG